MVLCLTGCGYVLGPAVWERHTLPARPPDTTKNHVLSVSDATLMLTQMGGNRTPTGQVVAARRNEAHPERKNCRSLRRRRAEPQLALRVWRPDRFRSIGRHRLWRSGRPWRWLGRLRGRHRFSGNWTNRYLRGYFRRHRGLDAEHAVETCAVWSTSDALRVARNTDRCETVRFRPLCSRV